MGVLLLSSLLLLCLFPAVSPAQQLAFPTAEGAGRFAQGGRGGKAYNINSLSNELGTGGSCNAGGCGGDAPFSAGTITLRDCLHDRFGVGARTCIFRVGGRIDYQCSHGLGPGGVPLGSQSCKVFQPYLTIAGQTAPGDGIMLSSMNLSFEGDNIHDIIVRHIRIRAGANIPQSCCCPTACPDGNNTNAYGYYPYHANNIIWDHVSLGWGRDDTVVLFTVRNITLQHVLWSEGLGNDNGGSDPSKILSAGRCEVENLPHASILHSLLSTYWYRTPNIGGCNVEVVNNVLYGLFTGPQVFPYYDPIQAAFINNYFKPNANGQDPNWDPYIVLIGCGADPGLNCDSAAATNVQVSGNLHSLQRPTLGALAEPALAYQHTLNTVPIAMQTSSLGIFAPIPSQTTAAQAYLNVLHQPGFTPGTIGAGARVPTFDSIDQRAISNVLNGTGSPLSNAGDEAYYGGFPTYNSGTPYPDTDGDGMADAWESTHGLNPNDAADGPVIAPNGYSNLENFLNELAGDVVVQATAPTVTITTPTSAATFSTTAATLPTLAGTASDDVSVTSVSVACAPACGTPTVSGTTSWSAANVPLTLGTNTITVTASDGTETGTDVLTVTRTTPGVVLDDFNRADQGPPPSANWTTGLVSGQPGLKVLGNTLVADTANTSSAWWNVSTFPANVRVSVDWTDATVAAVRGLRLYLRVTQPGVAGQTDGYFCQPEPTPPPITDGGVHLRRLDNGTATSPLASAGSIPWSAGDAAKCTMDGSQLCAHRMAAGSGVWTQLVCLTDTTYTAGGFVGVGLNHTEIAVDNFDAGALLSAPPTVTITAPTTSPTLSTSTTPLTTLAGTATDDVGVTSVTWACPTCTPTSGTATCATCGAAGTDVSWSVASVEFASGDNVITVTANDADVQTGTDQLTITYTPPVVSTTSPVAPAFSGWWAR